MRARPGAAAPGDPAASSPPGVPASAGKPGCAGGTRPARRGPSASGQWSSRSGTPGRAPRRDGELPSMRSRYPKCQTRPTSTSLSGPGARARHDGTCCRVASRAGSEYDFDSLGRSGVLRRSGSSSVSSDRGWSAGPAPQQGFWPRCAGARLLARRRQRQENPPAGDRRSARHAPRSGAPGGGSTRSEPAAR